MAAAIVRGGRAARDDRVAMALPNGMDAIVAFLAAAAAGTAAPLNPGYKFEEFCFYLADTRAKVLMAPAKRRRSAPRGGAGGHSRGHAGDCPARRGRRIPPRRYRAGAAHQRQHRTAEARAAAASQPGGVHPHDRGRLTRSAPGDVSLCLMPLFHVHGLMASTMATLLTGGTVVVPARFNALTFWRMVRDYGVTWYSAVPTMHQLILTRKRSGDEKLRFVRSCSAALGAGPDAAHGGVFRARRCWRLTG